MGSVWINARCNKVLGASASSHFCEIDPLIIKMNSEEPLPTHSNIERTAYIVWQTKNGTLHCANTTLYATCSIFFQKKQKLEFSSRQAPGKNRTTFAHVDERRMICTSDGSDPSTCIFHDLDILGKIPDLYDLHDLTDLDYDFGCEFRMTSLWHISSCTTSHDVKYTNCRIYMIYSR